MAAKRVLITGAGGMVGRNLCEHAASNSFILLTPNRLELNLLDKHAVEIYMGQKCPDIVIHAAGCVGGIQANIREPARFLIENLDMGRNLVMAAKQAGITKVLNLGSSCMYPRNASNPLSEGMILQGELEPTNEGYALAKIAIARLCEYISRESSDFLYKTLIPCNLYGRHDKFDPKHSHMLAGIIQKLHEAKVNRASHVDIWGDGNTRRECMYAGDLAECIWRCAQNLSSLPSLTNVGIGTDLSVREYYHQVAAVVGYEGGFKHDLSKPTGMKQKLICTDKATSWGWEAQTTLREGLEKTYDFYLKEIE